MIALPNVQPNTARALFNRISDESVHIGARAGEPSVEATIVFGTLNNFTLNQTVCKVRIAVSAHAISRIEIALMIAIERKSFLIMVKAYDILNT